ncbi:stimulated by retinoic acid gene 6 protein-like isoform X1 [Pogona vitticeps]
MNETGEEGDYDFFENVTCQSPIEVEPFLRYSLAPSLLIIIILSFLETRTRRCWLDEKLPRCSGCIGVLTPMDSLNVFSNRWTLGFAFGVIADKLIFLFEKDYFPEGFPSWAKVFWVMLLAIEVGVSSYPFFVCLSTRYAMTGAVLGFLYTAAWLAVTIVDSLHCPEEDVWGEYNKIILLWPSLVCYVFLLGQFVRLFVKAIRARYGLDSLDEETSLLEASQAQYVHRLLRKPPLEQPQKSWFRKKLYEWDPYFQFPSRIISTTVLIIVSLYIFVLGEFIMVQSLMKMIRKLFDIIKVKFYDGSEEMTSFFYIIEEFLDITKGAWFFSMAFSSVTCIGYIFNLLACYRKQIKLLRAGKKYLLVPESITISPSLSVISLGIFTAWQVAYILWGYLIMHLLETVLGMVLMYVLILPMKRGEWMELLNKWGLVILPIIIVMIIKKVQIFVAGRVFLQPKISPKDKEKPLALDNRKIFVNFIYFLFFHSVVVGLASCLWRLLRSVILGAWLVGRVDRPIMPKGFEEWDNGFKTWIQMLFLDHYHTNPILVCFCHILCTQNRERQLQTVKMDITGAECMKTVSGTRDKAKTRWLLLYTLLNNPTLQKFRKQRLEPLSMDSLLH